MHIPETPILNEDLTADWSGLKRFRRRLMMPFYRIPDLGIAGLTPLKTHALITGFPRSGTTLLLAMMEYAYPRARHFGHEVSGWRAATFTRRNHELVISKVPRDIFRLHRLENFYANRTAQLKTILVVRDPRDILTSHHAGYDHLPYYIDFDRWREYYRYVIYHIRQGKNLLVRYEDFVADVPTHQAKIEQFIGHKADRPFEDFHKAQRTDFDTKPLNGVRPTDTKNVARWKHPKHTQRLHDILRHIPEFPQMLRELQYETDESWIESLPPPPAPTQTPASNSTTQTLPPYSPKPTPAPSQDKARNPV